MSNARRRRAARGRIFNVLVRFWDNCGMISPGTHLPQRAFTLRLRLWSMLRYRGLYLFPGEHCGATGIVWLTCTVAAGRALPVQCNCLARFAGGVNPSNIREGVCSCWPCNPQTNVPTNSVTETWELAPWM